MPLVVIYKPHIYLFFQLESVLPTANSSHKHACVLQPHDTNVVAAVVRPAVLHALVSPFMFLSLHVCWMFTEPVSSCVLILSVSISLPPVSYWLPPLNTSGQTSPRLSLTRPILWASDLRLIAVATRKSR